MLHRATRHLDEHGRIVATLDDYGAVVKILGDAMAIATDKAVRKGTREIVEAVETLRADGANEKVSMRAASRKAGRSPSTTHTDVHDAIERGYLVSRSERPNQYDLDVGDPLPATEDLLPPREELEAKCRETGVFGPRSASVRPPTEHAIPVVEPKNTECSVCSVDSGGGGSDPVVLGISAPLEDEPFGGCSDPAGHRHRWRPDPLIAGTISCAVCVPFVGDDPVVDLFARAGSVRRPGRGDWS